MSDTDFLLTLNMAAFLVCGLLYIMVVTQHRRINELTGIVKKLAETWADDFSHHVEVENNNIDTTKHNFECVKITLERLAETAERQEHRIDRIIEDIENGRSL